MYKLEIIFCFLLEKIIYILKTRLNIAKKIIKFCLSIGFVFAAIRVLAQPALPEQTSPPRLVHDLAGLMSASERGVLEGRLRAYDDSTSSEVAVLTIPSLDGYPLDDYAYEVFNKWKIGQRGKNNGVLVLVAIKERKIKIQVGAGIGQKLTATRCAQIIDNVIKPAFKAQRYFDGFSGATQQIQRIAGGEFVNDGKGDELSDGAILFIIFLGIAIFAFVFYMAARAQKNQTASYGTRPRRYRRAYEDDSWRGGGGGGWIIGGGGSSWGDSGGGGSDWGGFGGGETDGGGASGDW